MSNFYFSPPERYDLKRIILGESSTSTGILLPIASSLSIGSFPNWISIYNYTAASGTYYYGIKWEFDNGGYSDWGNKLIGRTGIETNYILVNAPDTSSVYIYRPVSGDIVTTGNILECNSEYYITIDETLSGCLTYPLGSNYQFTFTSQYCPAFTTCNAVKFEVGGFINNLTDDTINRIIHKNSKSIMHRYISVRGSFPSGTYTCDGKLLADAFRKYVLCKSSLDSITAVQLSLGGQTMKKLGDMQINYAGIDARSDPINKKHDLKECIDAAFNVLFGLYNFQVGVRSLHHQRLMHPMNDASYGRLSTPGKSYPNEMDSKFNQISKNNI